MLKINPIFNTDAYKLSHKKFETSDTEYVQANFTPRSFRLSSIPLDKAVVFGTQRTVRKLVDIWRENFFDRPKEEVMKEAHRIFSVYLGMSKDDLKHFEDLHNLGYLPLRIKALPEGSRVSAKTPILLIENTQPEYSWLVTYLETWISTEMWLPMTSATTVYEFRKLVNEHAMKTTGSIVGTEFQLHDFSYRGMGPDEAGASGAGFLLSSWGTDTIPAICELEYYYDADIEKEPVAFSVPATEHSVTCVGIAVNGEKETIRNWITNVFPTGIVSIVSDTLDFFKVITEYATDLKDDILNRKVNDIGLAKVVFRPDSGDPVKILTGYKVIYFSDTYAMEDYIDAKGLSECAFEVVNVDGDYFEFDSLTGNLGKSLSEAEVKGAVECLWDIFGGTITEQGYKVLNERVGLIYGDSITYDRAEQIMERLAEKGFASTNCVFGVGSYTMRYVTRDTLGSAVKVTWAQVDGVEYAVAKDPKTDSGIKKSAKGYLDVIEVDGDFKLVESSMKIDRPQSAMKEILYNGNLENQTTLSEIRNRLWK